MYRIDINPTILQLIALYYLFGTWREEKSSPFCDIVRKLLILLNFILFQIMIIICAVQTTDKNEFIFLVEVEGHVFFLTMKLVFLLCKKDDLLAFIHGCAHTVVAHKEHMQAVKKIQNLMRFVNAYLFVMFVVLSFAILSSLPILSEERKLPLYTKFSFHTKYDEVIYWCSYAYMLYNLVFIIVLNSITIIIWYVMLNCSIKYQVLGSRLRNLGVIKASKSAVEQRSKADHHNSYIQDLVSLVKTHQSVSGTIDRFKLCFHNLFLVQITVSSIAICVSTYVLAFSSHENLFLSVTYVELLLYGITDIFLVMYLGNEIKVASSQLSYYVFESPWFDQPRSIKQNILILCEVLKQPKELIIFKLYPLNLETFTLIIKLSYSMYNILQNFT